MFYLFVMELNHEHGNSHEMCLFFTEMVSVLTPTQGTSCAASFIPFLNVMPLPADSCFFRDFKLEPILGVTF